MSVLSTCPNFLYSLRLVAGAKYSSTIIKRWLICFDRFYSRLFSSPECLIQRVQGISTTVLLPGFSVASIKLFLEVGEAIMATHQWEEVARLLRALEMSTGQV